MDDFFLQILNKIIIQLKLSLQGTIGDTPALAQEVQDLIQDIVKSHSIVPLRLLGARALSRASVLAIGDVIEYDPRNCNGSFG
jgi:hypothetical protein